MNKTTHSLRNGVFCALVFLACFWVAWPVAQVGFVDDWSYIKTTQVFAQTGHIAYNAWGAPMLGWMIPWGALFIKLFGFSFITVKLSTLPIAVVTLLLFHSILGRFAITPRNAVIGTLTLGLSPLFLPLSASFMTDIPGLFVIVLCLYCCSERLWRDQTGQRSGCGYERGGQNGAADCLASGAYLDQLLRTVVAHGAARGVV